MVSGQASPALDGTLRGSGRDSRANRRGSPASRISRSWPSAAALILAVAARSCSRRRRVGTSGPEASTSSSGLWSCSVGEAPTTGDRYLRAQHPKGSGLPPGLPQPGRPLAAAAAPLSPASPNAGPAGRRLLRDIGCHAGVPAHCQGQPCPEAPHPAQSLAKLPNLCDRRRAELYRDPATPARPPPSPRPAPHQPVQVGARRRRGPLLLGRRPPRPARLFSGRRRSAVSGWHRMGCPAFLKRLCREQTMAQSPCGPLALSPLPPYILPRGPNWPHPAPHLHPSSLYLGSHPTVSSTPGLTTLPSPSLYLG